MNCLAFCSRRRNDVSLVFAFVVRNFRWLARVPGAPQIFDSALLLSTALFSPRRLRAISAVETKAQRLADVKLGVHRYGGIGFFLHGKEMGHIHGNGLLDCRVGRTNRDRLLQTSAGVTAHHVFPQSGWISFFVKAPDDVGQAIELIRIACAYRESAEDRPQQIRAKDLG
jgi:hypothetical protein